MISFNNIVFYTYIYYIKNSKNLFISFHFFLRFLYVRVMCILAVVTETTTALPVVPAYPFTIYHLCVVFTWNLTVIAYVLDDCVDNSILNIFTCFGIKPLVKFDIDVNNINWYCYSVFEFKLLEILKSHGT